MAPSWHKEQIVEKVKRATLSSLMDGLHLPVSVSVPQDGTTVKVVDLDIISLET